MGLSGCLGGFVVGVYPNQRVKINDLWSWIPIAMVYVREWGFWLDLLKVRKQSYLWYWRCLRGCCVGEWFWEILIGGAFWDRCDSFWSWRHFSKTRSNFSMIPLHFWSWWGFWSRRILSKSWGFSRGRFFMIMVTFLIFPIWGNFLRPRFLFFCELFSFLNINPNPFLYQNHDNHSHSLSKILTSTKPHTQFPPQTHPPTQLLNSLTLL